MFNDMMDMMGKLRDTQAKIAATKKSLDTVHLIEDSADGLLQVKILAKAN